MSWIQILLILGTVAGLWIYFSYFKTVTRNRVLLILLGLSALFLILNPESLTWIAHRLGVGRGTDLLLYLSLLMGIFAILNLTAKLSQLERERTSLAREIAILSTQIENASKESHVKKP
jgi:hypothetical protein